MASSSTPTAAPHPHYDRLIAAARALPPLRVAVVHPANAVSLEAALASAALGLIAPVLVGPRAKIEAAALEAGASICAPHHRRCAAQPRRGRRRRGHGLARRGRCVDEGQPAHRRADGRGGAARGRLRTSRRISHCFVMDIPGHSQPLVISDAAINIAPTLEEKVDIVQNAIDLAHALHMPAVRVAILSATETVNAKVPSTLDAAVLCKMADRGQITGAQLDGPLALDNAIDAEAARIKGIVSPVAGRANVLIVPDLDAGNMLAKSLTFLGGAYAAGIVLGTKVPVILTSRADSESARLASCAVASMLVKAGRERLIKAVG
jgi:phosphate acetyltransferase